MKARRLLLMGLLLAATVACSANAVSGQDRNSILSEMLNTVKADAIPARLELTNKAGWGAGLLVFGIVKREPGLQDGYRITFPPFPDQSNSVEEWLFHRSSHTVSPMNSGALLTATYLFCESRNDLSLRCDGYFAMIDTMKEGMR